MKPKTSIFQNASKILDPNEIIILTLLSLTCNYKYFLNAALY